MDSMQKHVSLFIVGNNKLSNKNSFSQHSCVLL